MITQGCRIIYISFSTQTKISYIYYKNFCAGVKRKDLCPSLQVYISRTWLILGKCILTRINVTKYTVPNMKHIHKYISCFYIYVHKKGHTSSVILQIFLRNTFRPPRIFFNKIFSCIEHQHNPVSGSHSSMSSYLCHTILGNAIPSFECIFLKFSDILPNGEITALGRQSEYIITILCTPSLHQQLKKSQNCFSLSKNGRFLFKRFVS